MIKERISKLRGKFNEFNIDGYVIPKNDEFFSEYTQKDRLKTISNFTGSAGYAIILKNKNYLFVDGRYSIQAEKESAREFKIIKLNKIKNCKLFKNLVLGIDPNLFTLKEINTFFKKYNKIKEIKTNLVDCIYNNYFYRSKPFFSLSKKIVGESYLIKIKKIASIIKKNKSNYLFVTAPENVAWLLNIRGNDNPNSPIPNCRMIISSNKEIFLICEKIKAQNLIKEKKIKKDNLILPKDFESFIKRLKKNKIIIDETTCSLFYEKTLKRRFLISSKIDPIYLMKSIKNKIEIDNMINSHIFDGVALTKFLFWIKNKNKNEINEYQAQLKLENFRKKNKNYLYPSFNTIAGAG